MKALSLLIFVFCSSLIAKPTQFKVRDAAQRDLITFESDAPLEKIVGINRFIQGSIEFDPDKIESGITGEFKVDMRAFDTDIELRNVQIRNYFFDTKNYPFAQYTIQAWKSAPKGALKSWPPLKGIVEGRLKFRGIERSQPFDFSLQYFKQSDETQKRFQGNLIRLRAKTLIRLSDYQVPWDKGWMLVLLKEIPVEVAVVGTDHSPETIIVPPDAPKPK